MDALDGVRRLPKIWKKVTNKEGDYIYVTVSEMESWKLQTRGDRSPSLTSPYKYMIGYPSHLFKRAEKQYLEGSIEGVDWLTNYHMSVVTFKIFICKIIGAIPLPSD